MPTRKSNRMIPLVKVGMPQPDLLMPSLQKVLYSGFVGEGEHVAAFEKQFAAHFGYEEILALSSGTAALHIALILSGAGPDTEVVTTSMTAEPTNTTILQVGATPVFADVNPATGNLEPQSVEEKITAKTRAICVVHYAGYPADTLALRKIADRHGIRLIEDCAHALGARQADLPIGAIGDFAIFSFQAIKHFTTIDGGALIIKDETKRKLAKKLRWFGLEKGIPRTEVDIVEPGYKYNMNNVTAVIGLKQLENIQFRIDRHVSNGQFFDTALSKISGIEPATIGKYCQPTYWLYTLLADDADDVVERLKRVGVEASKLHRPNHYHTVFAPFAGKLQGLENFYKRLIHIPCGWWVTDDDRAVIAEALSKG